MSNGKCYAPVFRSNNITACVFLRIIYTIVIMMLIIGTFGLILLSAKGRCLIKQYQFRMIYCLQGNNDPNRFI